MLKRRKAVYEAAKQQRPERWRGQTRNLGPVRVVSLNPDTVIVQLPLFLQAYLDVRRHHRSFGNLDSDFSDIYSMHLWWLDEKRTDCSNFHNGLLKGLYIRNIDMTYYIVARRYLE